MGWLTCVGLLDAMAGNATGRGNWIREQGTRPLDGMGSDSKLGHGASHGLGWGDVRALIMGTCKARAAV